MADKDQARGAGKPVDEVEEKTTRQLGERAQADVERAEEGPGTPTDLVGKPVAHEPWNLPGQGEAAGGKEAPPEERRKQPR